MLKDKFTKSIGNIISNISQIHEDTDGFEQQKHERFYSGDTGYFPYGDTVNIPDHYSGKTWDDKPYSGPSTGTITGVKERRNEKTLYRVQVTLPKDHPEAVDGESGERTDTSHIKHIIIHQDELSKLNPNTATSLKESAMLTGFPKWAGESINEFAPLVGMALRGAAMGAASNALSSDDEDDKSEQEDEQLHEISSDLRQSYIKQAMPRVRSQIQSGDKQKAVRTAKFMQKALSKETDLKESKLEQRLSAIRSQIKESAGGYTGSYPVEYDIPSEHRGNKEVHKAAIKARAISEKERCVQHVNINKLGHVHVSDWHAGNHFDPDMSPDNDHRNEKTIMSYNNGRSL